MQWSKKAILTLLWCTCYTWKIVHFYLKVKKKWIEKHGIVLHFRKCILCVPKEEKVEFSFLNFVPPVTICCLCGREPSELGTRILSREMEDLNGPQSSCQGPFCLSHLSISAQGSQNDHWQVLKSSILSGCLIIPLRAETLLIDLNCPQHPQTAKKNGVL